MSTPRLSVTCENMHILCYCHSKLIFSLVTRIPEISISTSSVKTFFFFCIQTVYQIAITKEKQTKKTTQINNPKPFKFNGFKNPKSKKNKNKNKNPKSYNSHLPSDLQAIDLSNLANLCCPVYLS